MTKHDFTKSPKSSHTPKSGLSLDDIRKGGEQPAQSISEEAESPMCGKVEQWPIEYKGSDGKLFNWTVTSEVPAIDTRIKIGIAASRLAGGISWDALPAETCELCHLLARCSFQLSNVPKQMEEVMHMDHAFATALFDKCMEHETRYFRDSFGESKGDKGEVSRFKIG